MMKHLGPLTIAAMLLILAATGCRSSSQVGDRSASQAGISAHFDASPPTYTASAATSTSLSLSEALRQAGERHPRLSAERMSLLGAQDGRRALDRLHFPARLDGQFPYRRRQADLGLAAASARLEQVEIETAYAVHRTYISVLYAREQERVAAGIVDRLTATKELAQRGLDAGTRDVTASDVNRTIVYLKLAQTRRIQAAEGVKRAVIALREAIGVGPETAVDPPAGSMPDVEIQPQQDEIVALALKNRREMIQVQAFAQVACLEIDAQATSLAQKMPTFAAGSDIHAQPVPEGSNGPDYRPGAVSPEMPALLVGTRPERMKHAQTLSARAASVVETTRNLIALEAEDAFLRWREAAGQTREAKEAAEAGDKLADDLRKDFTAGLKVKVDEVVTARVLAAQARSEYNQFLYRKLVALADLERVTARGFRAGLAEAIDASPAKKP